MCDNAGFYSSTNISVCLNISGITLVVAAGWWCQCVEPGSDDKEKATDSTYNIVDGVSHKTT